MFPMSEMRNKDDEEKDKGIMNKVNALRISPQSMVSNLAIAHLIRLGVW